MPEKIINFLIKELKNIFNTKSLKQEFSKFNPDDVFEKTNRLIRTALLGMAEFESIPRFRFDGKCRFWNFKNFGKL